MAEYLDEYGVPHPHSHHHSATYVEPDYLADITHGQLPTLSTMGRGPRGKGVKPKIVDNKDGSFKFSLVDDETGEQVMLSPNLSPGEITIEQLNHDPVSGEDVTLDIRVGDEHNYITIPSGAVGSRWFCVKDKVEYKKNHVYIFDQSKLMYDGLNAYRRKPTPRQNDLVVFVTTDGRIVFGNIDANEGGQASVVALSEIACPIPSINEKGNWAIDGVDLNTPAQGPKGEKGDKGDKGAQGERGPQGQQGDKGLRGEAGKPAIVEIGDVSTLPPTRPASVTAKHDAVTNVTTINFGIPEGAAGKAINVRGGIWKTDYLPPYDDTPVNDAFIVYDGDKQFDLYIRGAEPYQAEDGGPWTVVEDWQGRPGTGVKILKKPYQMDSEPGEILSVPAAEGGLAFEPSDLLTDGDVILDEFGHIGILGSTEDDSGDYTITTVGSNDVDWSNVQNKPFSSVMKDDGLSVSDDVLHIVHSELEPNWDNVQDKPFDELSDQFIAEFDQEEGFKLTLDIDEDDLEFGENGLSVIKKPVKWEDVEGFPKFGAGFSMEVTLDPETKEPAYLTAVNLSEDVFIWRVSNGIVKTGGGNTTEPIELQLDVTNDFGFDEDGKLKLAKKISWDDIQDKPTFGDTGDVTVSTEWEDITSKPFSSIGEDFSVDESGMLSIAKAPIEFIDDTEASNLILIIESAYLEIPEQE